MTQQTSIIEPNDSKNASEWRLQPHVQRFLAITHTLDAAVRGKDENAISAAKDELAVFYGTLTADEQRKLQQFAEKEVFGKVIEDHRGWFHRSFVRLINMPQRIVGASAEPVARLAGETVRLITLTLGWTVVGIVRGVRGTVNEILQHAA